MAFNGNLKAHLKTGATCVARAWEVVRKDGVSLGFTDHDRDLSFDGLLYRADTGLTAQSVAQSTGFSVDNAEALGALSSAAISKEDIRAGRYDGARVKAWLVNWMSPDDRELMFQGHIGEIAQAGGEFRAELRGLTEALNTPHGRVFQKPCSAVLGDGDCGIDLSQPGYSTEIAASGVEGNRVFTFDPLPGFADSWFERGRLSVLDGAAKGLLGIIKTDKTVKSSREITLWEALRAPVAAGDLVRIDAGCDKSAETCKVKFSNFVNYRGFPDIPGEDWLLAYPRSSPVNTGGSLKS